jgi:rRNA maturation endonuclease Nob1|tara:strand:- start:8043 stop:10448 length:2406 start_codon:yes stop_codon:yes gene_type:complete
MAADSKKLLEIQKLLDKIQKSYNEIGKDNPFQSFDTSKVSDADAAIKRLEVSLDGVNSKVRAANTSFGDLEKILKSVVNEFNPKAINASKELEKGMKGLVNEARKLANEEEDIGNLSKKNLEKILERAKASQKMAQDNAAKVLEGIKLTDENGNRVDATNKKYSKRFQSFKKLSEEQKAALDILHDENDIQKDLLDKIQQRIDLEDKFTSKLGIAGQAAEGLDKALKKAGLPSLGISDAIGEARKNFIKTNGESSVFGDTMKGIGKSLKKSLSFTNMMQLSFGLLVKSILEVDKASGTFAKNNGISYKNALKVRGEMSKIARNSKDIMVDSKSLMETQNTLNSYFGQSVKFTGKLAEDMTSISKRTGLSEAAQGVFALESLKSGKGVKSILQTQTLQVREMNKQKGLNMSVKQIQEEIGKTSKSLQLTFKGSTEELTKQVMQVKALGANMQQASTIASSLLNFESSIQAELEAELLLGKDINLEKARAAALEGDRGKMAEEVMKNSAIMNAFETKNVIAQEAAAKALGLSRDDLASMVMEQQKMNALQGAFGDDVQSMSDAQKHYNDLRDSGLSAAQAASELSDEDLAAQLESVSQAEKFEQTMARVQEIFIGFAEPILGLVEGITSMVGGAEHLANILIGIAGIYAGIRTYQAISAALSRREIKNEKKKLALKTGQAAAASVINPVAAVAGLAVAGLAIAAIYSSMKDGVIDPKKGPVISGEFGTVQIDPNDQIAVGTDLMGENKPKGEKDSRGGNNTALISAVQQLISVNQKILAKSTIIEMNGNEVGQEINQSERAIQ